MAETQHVFEAPGGSREHDSEHAGHHDVMDRVLRQLNEQKQYWQQVACPKIGHSVFQLVFTGLQIVSTNHSQLHKKGIMITRLKLIGDYCSTKPKSIGAIMLLEVKAELQNRQMMKGDMDWLNHFQPAEKDLTMLNFLGYPIQKLLSKIECDSMMLP